MVEQAGGESQKCQPAPEIPGPAPEICHAEALEGNKACVAEGREVTLLQKRWHFFCVIWLAGVLQRELVLQGVQLVCSSAGEESLYIAVGEMIKVGTVLPYEHIWWGQVGGPILPLDVVSL